MVKKPYEKPIVHHLDYPETDRDSWIFLNLLLAHLFSRKTALSRFLRATPQYDSLATFGEAISVGMREGVLPDGYDDIYNAWHETIAQVQQQAQAMPDVM